MPKSPRIKNDTQRRVDLDPAIRSIADRIFALDKRKFRRLIVWIKEAEHYHFHPAVIERALKDFEPYAMRCSNRWYAYLDKLAVKAEGQYNAQMARTESQKHKRGVDAKTTAVLSEVLGNKTE